MHIQAVYIALQSSFEIEEVVNQSFQEHPGAMGDYVMISVRRASSNKTSSLEVAFCKNHPDLLRGQTKEGEIVLIKLGETAERRNKYPSVIVSSKRQGHSNPCDSR